jgi:glycosyltransferase involved in cell wall biosynthesis
LRQLHREIAPDIVHHVAMQCTVLGSLAALGNRARIVNALTGFGFVFTGPDARRSVLRRLVITLLRWLLNRRNTIALVQNPDDRAALADMGIGSDRIALISGSGVDVNKLHPVPEPAEPVTVTFVGRLLDDKGIRTLIAAHRVLRQRGNPIMLLIAGTPDHGNPASVSDDEVQSWSGIPGITCLGHVTDIAGLWARSHIAVLPSRREGLPKSLLEAAAFGRPMVATDVPGCREIVVQDVTGILVPPDDAPALADAIVRMAASPALRARYGAAARALVVEKFSAEAIGAQIVDLYRALEQQA